MPGGAITFLGRIASAAPPFRRRIRPVGRHRPHARPGLRKRPCNDAVRKLSQRSVRALSCPATTPPVRRPVRIGH